MKYVIPVFSSIAQAPATVVVEPIQLRAPRRQLPMPMIERVLAYITEHRGCTGSDMAEEFGLPVTAISVHTTRLRNRGIVRKTKIPGDRSPKWEAGCDPEVELDLEQKDQPKQSSVSTWTPHHSRDPLVAFLFGEAR